MRGACPGRLLDRLRSVSGSREVMFEPKTIDADQENSCFGGITRRKRRGGVIETMIKLRSCTQIFLWRHCQVLKLQTPLSDLLPSYNIANVGLVDQHRFYSIH